MFVLIYRFDNEEEVREQGDYETLLQKYEILTTISHTMYVSLYRATLKQ